MKSDYSIIDSIESKVERLIADNKKLRAQCDKLATEIGELKRERRELEQKLAKQDERLNVVELAEGFSGSGENRDLARARVNRLVREVDRCLALLNRES